MSHAHSVTAFHFFTSNRLRWPVVVSAVVVVVAAVVVVDEPLGTSASSVFMGVGSDGSIRQLSLCSEEDYLELNAQISQSTIQAETKKRIFPESDEGKQREINKNACEF